MRTAAVWSLAFALIMLLTPLAIALGVVLGLLRGGSLSALKSVQVRYWPLLILGIVLQSAEHWGDLGGRLVLYLVGVALLMTVTMLNVHLKGAAITGFGLTLNLMTVLVNGHVPLRVESFKAVGGMPLDSDPADYTIVNGLWQFEDDDTLLRPLGDIVPVPVLDDVVSFGDLIMLAGLIVLSMHLLRRQPRRSVSIDELFPDETTTVAPAETPTGALDLRDPQIDLDQAHDASMPSPCPSASRSPYASSPYPLGSVAVGTVTIMARDLG